MGTCHGHKTPWDLEDPDSYPHPTPNLHSSRVPLITSPLLAETWPEPWSYNLHILGTIGGFYHRSILSSGCSCPLAGVLLYRDCMKKDERPHEGTTKAQISIPKNALHQQRCTGVKSEDMSWACTWVWMGMKIKHHRRHGQRHQGALQPRRSAPSPPHTHAHMHACFEAQYKDAISLKKKQKRKLVRRDFFPLNFLCIFFFFTLNTRFIHFPLWLRSWIN